MVILEELAHGPLTVQSVAKMTGVSRATAHRLIKTMEAHRLVVRDLMGRYAVGPRLSQLANARDTDPLHIAIDQILAGLAGWSGLEAFLFWAQGVQRICIAATGIETSHQQIGRRYEPSDSATSQVLLAWSSSNRLAARGRYSITTADLTQVRKRGWAYSLNKAGWAGTSAPVRNDKGDVIGAVTIYGPQKTGISDASNTIIASDANSPIALPHDLGSGVKAAGEQLSQALANLADAVPNRDIVPIEWYI